MWSLDEFLDQLPEPNEESLISIKKALSKFDMGFFSLSEQEKMGIINEVMDECGKYIEKVPKAERSYKIDEQLLQQKYPNLRVVDELSKNCYRFTTLKHYVFDADPIEGFAISKQRYLAKARWGLIKGIHGTGKGKPLHNRFWHEYRVQGNLEFSNWLVTDFEIISAREIKEMGYRGRGISYLKNAEPLQVHFQNGKMWVRNKENLVLLDSKESLALHELIYVIDTNEKMYASYKFAELEPMGGGFQHSSFLSGKEVICAGYMTVVDGVLKSIGTGSGHYRPAPRHLVNALKVLKAKGIDLKQCQVDHGGLANEQFCEKNAELFLQTNGYCLPTNIARYLFENMLDNIRGYHGKGIIPDSEIKNVRSMLEFCANQGYVFAKAMLAKELYLGGLIDEKEVAGDLKVQIKKDKATAIHILAELISVKEQLKPYEVEYINGCLKSISDTVVKDSPEGKALLDMYHRLNESPSSTSKLRKS